MLKKKLLRVSIWFAIIQLALRAITASATPQWTVLPLATRNGQIEAAAEVLYDNRQPPPRILVGGSSTLTQPADRTLAEYYRLVKTQQLNLLPLLFTTADSSRERLTASLRQNPNQFSGYTALQQVSLTYEFRWGAYHLLGVLLEGGGHRLEWREDVLCENNGCALSNAMDNNHPAEELAEALFYGILDPASRPLSATTASMLRNNNKRLDVWPPYQLRPENPIRLYANLTSPATSDELISLNTPVVDSRSAIGFLVQSLQHLRETPETEANLATVVSTFWLSDDNETEGALTLNRIEESTNPTLVLYTWPAFAAHLRDWSALRIVGTAHVDNHVFIYVQPRSNDNKSGALQVFTVYSLAGSWRLGSADRLGVSGVILQSPAFLQLIQNAYPDTPR